MDNINLNSPLFDFVIEALKDKKILHIKEVGWVYLVKNLPSKNPQTGEEIPPATVSRVVCVPIGTNFYCKGDHENFFASQNIAIAEVDCSPLAFSADSSKKFFVIDSKERPILRVSFSTLLGIKTSNFTLNKELRAVLEEMSPYIEEVFDWNDLQTPADRDNPRPRLGKLVLF